MDGAFSSSSSSSPSSFLADESLMSSSHVSTPWSDNDVLGVQSRNEVLPFVDNDSVAVKVLTSILQQFSLNGLQQLGDLSFNLFQLDDGLGTVVTSHSGHQSFLQVLRTEFNSDWNTLQFPVTELPTRSVVVSVVTDGSDVGLLQSGLDISSTIVDDLSVFVRSLSSQSNWDNNDLSLGHSWRQHQTLVVGVGHNHNTNDTGGQTPRVLECMDSWFVLTLWVLHRDVEHLGEVSTQVVGSSTSNTSTGGSNEALDGCGVVSTSELLVFGLSSFNNWNSQQLFVNSFVQLQDSVDLSSSVVSGQVGGVALSPQELTGSQERLWVLELPSDDRVPSVQFQWQVSVGSDPLGVVWVIPINLAPSFLAANLSCLTCSFLDDFSAGAGAGSASKSTTTSSIPVDCKYATSVSAGTAARDDSVDNNKAVWAESTIFWSTTNLILPAKSLCKLAMENSLAVVEKNSSTKSSLANSGSLTPAALATTFPGVWVDCKANTTNGTGVADLAVFGLKTKVLVGVASSSDTWANDNAAKVCSKAMKNEQLSNR